MAQQTLKYKLTEMFKYMELLMVSLYVIFGLILQRSMTQWAEEYPTRNKKTEA